MENLVQTFQSVHIAAPATKERIGVLGGTFNPPHNGHIAIADIAKREFDLGKVLFLPLGTPPHKELEGVLSREQRLAMAKLIVAERPWLELSTIELEREGYTYTIDTLRYLNANMRADIWYIIGADTLFELETWREHEKVFELCTFACIGRPGDDVESVRLQARYLEEKYGKKIYISEASGPDISSTDLRELIAHGASVRGLVPNSIADFLESNHVFE